MANTTLHTLNKSAFHSKINEKLSFAISEGDDVILIENGVYQCLQRFSPEKTEIHSPWSENASEIYALKDDAIARGIPLDSKKIRFISYEEFVQLSLKHKKVISWY